MTGRWDDQEEKADARQPQLRVLDSGPPRKPRGPQIRRGTPRGWLYLALGASAVIGLTLLGFAIWSHRAGPQTPSPTLAAVFAGFEFFLFAVCCVVAALAIRDLRGGQYIGGRRSDEDNDIGE